MKWQMRVCGRALTAAAIVSAALVVAPAASAFSPTTVAVPAIVPANGSAASSGVTLAAGEEAVVTASGIWDTCGGACPTDANGMIGNYNSFVDPSAVGGSMIGSLDGGGSWFLVGDGPTIVTGPGTLLLAANDFGFDNYIEYGDNSGSIAATVAPLATNKSQCKNGGWQTSVDSTGTSFKNQGDCVSFVATGGRNLASGA